MGQRASAAVMAALSASSRAGRRAVALSTRVCALPHSAYCRLHVNLFTRVQYPGVLTNCFLKLVFVRWISSPPARRRRLARQGWRGARGMERAVLPARTLRMTRHRRTTTSAGPPNGRGRGRSATEAGAGSGGSGIAVTASGIGIARNGARPRRAAPARPGGLDRPGAVRPAGTRERTGASVSAIGRVDPSDTTPSATAMRAAGRRGWPLRHSVPSAPTCAASARSFGGMAS